MLRSNNGISYFIVAITKDQHGSDTSLLVNNEIIWQYKNKPKVKNTRFYMETQDEKSHEVRRKLHYIKIWIIT